MYWFVLHLGLGTAYSIFVIYRQLSPISTFAWILAFFLFPYGGPLLYSFFGFSRLRTRKRLAARHAKIAEHVDLATIRPRLTQRLPENQWRLARLGAALTDFGVVDGNRIRIFEEAYSTYGAIAQAVRGAQHHVHLEYYKFQSDETGRYFRDVLCEVAKRGVQTRLLLDALGCIRLSRSFLAPLKNAGVEVQFFWPLKLLRPWGWHLRNHRKLVVIDGKTAFIGSQNIGNEYLQWRNRKLSWKDTTVRVHGAVVRQIQTLFVEDWSAITQQELKGDTYFPELTHEGFAAPGRALVQTIPTGPDENENALELILMEMFAMAEKRVTLTTPYFVPSPALLLAMEGAVRRGVQVQILVPERSDLPWVDFAGRSWQRDLIRAGVEVFTFSKTFVHAKVVTVDGAVALVGSANMDIRSFSLNFESSVLMYDSAATIQLEESFFRTAEAGQRIQASVLAARHWWSKWLEGFFRVLSPLL